MSKPLIIDSAEFAREQQDLRGGKVGCATCLVCWTAYAIRTVWFIFVWWVACGSAGASGVAAECEQVGRAVMPALSWKSLDWVIDGESLLTLFDSEAVIDAAAEQG